MLLSMSTCNAPPLLHILTNMLVALKKKNPSPLIMFRLEGFNVAYEGTQQFSPQQSCLMVWLQVKHDRWDCRSRTPGSRLALGSRCFGMKMTSWLQHRSKPGSTGPCQSGTRSTVKTNRRLGCGQKPGWVVYIPHSLMSHFPGVCAPPRWPCG